MSLPLRPIKAPSSMAAVRDESRSARPLYFENQSSKTGGRPGSRRRRPFSRDGETSRERTWEMGGVWWCSCLGVLPSHCAANTKTSRWYCLSVLYIFINRKLPLDSRSAPFVIFGHDLYTYEPYIYLMIIEYRLYDRAV
ncbi:MAG: hypothetical protein NXY57DRAFT_1042565 [Lentinula lateritia]|uniref:Uncharacterized protein n=1 Tax=Lentinula lateritia TaxID=40482 RepID=A0ABQ8UZZ2_9AGAR|nr:MAG: hypothetical protein NXY57DRAFT_1042565 [Lentinula lateritia]KAJ4465723.1 hypothetical protein C8R41DRAFT_871833 [Lentinula lateritia]